MTNDNDLPPGLIQVTPELLDEIKAAVQERERELDEDVPKLVDACDYETKLAVCCWFTQKLFEHAKGGGTYRYLLYDRLGFGPDSYAVLQLSGLLDLHNFISGELLDEPDEVSS